MFKTNSDNRKPNRDGLNRSKRDKTPSDGLNSQSDFSDLNQFAQWLDRQLAILEHEYEEFETKSSVRGHLGR